ncbi:threonine aldolase family protein [Streptomyces sp. NBC_01497]|uniref:threonine aldolase family protein n=1 Tax=Streptomyces sp. NBC_01497 TaxID=2903885 RepID=UPI002E378064|nr:beta-eliminating lyase-related protein [Streptomyces sp. NBC_01497]
MADENEQADRTSGLSPAAGGGPLEGPSGAASGTAPEAPGEGPPGGPSGPADDAAARARRRAAFAGARRTLRQGWGTTVRERMAELARTAETVHDLDDFTDIYGDGVVAALEARVAELLGFPDAAFFPTGTMAQQAALRSWAGRTGNPVVALHPLAHPEVHEEGALSAVSGLRTVHPTTERRLPTAEEVRTFGEPFGTLMLELPLRDAGFVLPSWDELTAVVDAARERDAVVHFDGARLWETTTHFGRPLHEIAGLADSVYVSFYKSLGGLSGAVLAGPGSMVAEARSWRHRYGGNLYQQFPAALSALAGLDDVLPRLPLYVAHARLVASAIAEAFTAAPGIPWFRVHPEPPHTQEFQVWLPFEAETLTEAAVSQAEDTGIALFGAWSPGGGAPGVSMTEVSLGAPALTWTADEVKEAATEFARRAAGPGPGA